MKLEELREAKEIIDNKLPILYRSKNKLKWAITDLNSTLADNKLSVISIIKYAYNKELKSSELIISEQNFPVSENLLLGIKLQQLVFLKKTLKLVEKEIKILEEKFSKL